MDEMAWWTVTRVDYEICVECVVCVGCVEVLVDRHIS